MRLFVIRHGETAWNVEGRFQGQRDTELNERGRAQAATLRSRLATHPFAAVVSSPLKRASETAKIALGRGADHLLEAFTEIHHGDWEGRLADDVRATWPDLLHTWHTAPDRVRMPGEGGETLLDVQTRALTGIAMIKGIVPGAGDVFLATHDAVIKTLLCACTDAPLSSFWLFQVPNCSICILEFPPDKLPRLLLMGDIAHLDNPFDAPVQKGL